MPKNIRREVSIKKVVNGYIVSVSVSSQNKYTQNDYIAKSEQEAKKLASKYL